MVGRGGAWLVVVVVVVVVEVLVVEVGNRQQAVAV